MPTGIIIVADRLQKDAEGVMCFAPTHNVQTYRSYRQLRILTKTSADMAAFCVARCVGSWSTHQSPSNPNPIPAEYAEFPTMSQATANPSRALTFGNVTTRASPSWVIHGHPKIYPLGVQEQNSKFYNKIHIKITIHNRGMDCFFICSWIMHLDFTKLQN